MLERLIVKDIALIADAELVFSPHLTVLSGETGAGKTALLFALRLLVGERSDSTMIRDGATSACVEAVFSDPAAGTSLKARRRIESSGRSLCAIDGHNVTVAQMAETIGPMLDLHGQHEHQTLLQVSSHVSYFDAWIGDDVRDARAAYEEAFDGCVRAKADYDALVRASSASVAEREVARLALREIEAVSPQEGEYDRLTSELPLLEHADALATAVNAALAALRREGGADDSLAEAHVLLERQEGIDAHLDELTALLSDIIAQSEDVASELRAYRDTLDSDPAALQAHHERLAALDGLCRRFGPRMQDVFERAEEARRTLELAEDSSGRLDEARAYLSSTDGILRDRAAELARIRADAADDFTGALCEATSALAMEGASFMLAMTDLPREAWSREGAQHIELLYSPGPSIAARPLAKIASGGELSRVMLALISEVDLTAADTLVFDEVDAGIGGATANLVARHLSELSEGHQVIVVTHLPQIAVFADAHLLVVKNGASGEAPRTSVRPITGEARVAEIARMLSGSDEGVSLEHARAMLASVGHAV